MKTIRRFTISLFALTLLVMTAPSRPVAAQTVPLPRTVEPVFGFVSADDTDTALLIRYIASSALNNSGEVAVAVTTSDMTFLQGPVGSLIASTEFECPVSGPLGGVIDVSNAACNTAGEVCDVINASSSWRCIILDGVRSDVLDARLVTRSTTKADSTDGVPIFWDTSTAFQATTALTPFRKMSDYITGIRTLRANVYDNTRTGLFLGSALSTYGSGTSNIRFYSVKVNQTSPTKWSEVVTQIYFTPGGASTVAQTYDFRDIGLWGRSGEKVIARLDNSAAATTVTFRTYGLFARAQNAVPGRP